MALMQACLSVGFIIIAEFPTTSGIDEVFDVKTGTPHDIASNGGIPKPSYKEIYVKNKELLYKVFTSSSSTYPNLTILSLYLSKSSISFSNCPIKSSQ